MNFESISVTNVLGCSSGYAKVPSSGVVLVAGVHASGKSSFLEAIRLLAIGDSERAPRAVKDWRQLLTDGEQSGQVILVSDEGTMGLTLPQGAATGKPLSETPAIKVAMGATLFSAMKPGDRIGLLRQLAGGTSGAEKVILKRLEERGHGDGYLNRIGPLLKSGLEAAEKEAIGMARETKGAWRAITGDNYGSAKAASWAPAGTPPLAEGTDFQEAISKANKSVQDTERALSAAERALGQVEGVPIDELENLRTAAARYGELEDVRLQAERAHRDAQARVEAAELLVREAATQRSGLLCPHCEQPVRLENGELLKNDVPTKPVDWTKADADRKATAQELKDAKRALTEATTAVVNAEAAAAKVRALEKISPEAQAKARREVQAARDARDAAQRWQREANESRDWFSRRRQATDAHAIVQAWTSLAEDLGPQGVVTDLSTGPLADFQSALDDITPMLGFDRVRLADDGAMAMLTHTGVWRDYGFCSESERWRVDIAHQVAAAWMAQAPIVVIDRLDILLPSLRPKVLMGLSQLGFPLALVGCAAANKPALPEELGLLWFETRAGEPA